VGDRNFVRHTRFQLTAVKAESRSLKLPSTQITPIAGTLLWFPGSATNADDFSCPPTGSSGVLLSNAPENPNLNETQKQRSAWGSKVGWGCKAQKVSQIAS